jgi:ParB family chromosome partitioning protein
MTDRRIESIPISEIRVINPRTRDKRKFQIIVGSIQAIGLKKPITVSRHAPNSDGTQYDLICGQGRMEAMLALGETTIPAIVTEASKEEQYLMSLIENLARKPPSNRDLVREVRVLMERKYTTRVIAQKLGLDRAYIHGVVQLVRQGEESLVAAAEAGRLPITIAVQIASGNDHEVQKALAEAYEKGDLRGGRLSAVKRIISQRIAKLRRDGKEIQAKRNLTGNALVREYQRQIREQKILVRKANSTKEQLLLLVSALRQVLADAHFVTLLQAEDLADMPEQLAIRLG